MGSQMVSSLVILAVLSSFTLIQGRSYVGGRLDSGYCYSSDLEHPQYRHLASKTPYQLAKGGSTIAVPNGCTPSKFWLVSRHGTRLPTSSKTEKLMELPKYQAQILDNYSGINADGPDTLCYADLTLLDTWRWNGNITTDKDGFLTTQGWDDLKGIAQYYKEQLPSLFGDYSQDKYQFEFSESQRTEASYKGFVEGLFGERAWEKISAPEATDEMLRPYRTCSLWRDQEDAIEEPNSELSKFLRSDIYIKALKDVSTKAGYSTTLSKDEVEIMLEMCGLEVGWNLNRLSPWCTLFNLEQIKIFEYAADLEEWSLTGPVTTLNERLTCVLTQDLLRRMEDNDGPTVAAYFSHSTLVQLFLTTLGYTHPQLNKPLLAENYEQQSDRTFLTSKNTPLASNVAVVRYDCSEGTKVQFFFNEMPMHLSWCNDGYCNWSDVKERFKELSSQTCSTYHCSSGATKTTWWSLSVLGIATLFVILF